MEIVVEENEQMQWTMYHYSAKLFFIRDNNQKFKQKLEGAYR